MSELDIVEKLRRMAAQRPLLKPRSADVRKSVLQKSMLTLGIGDDCAIFRPSANEDLIFTTDQMIENVHFRRTQSPALIGQRALGRSLSDIAAMGGEPRFCLVSLALPAAFSEKNKPHKDRSTEKWLMSFYKGLLALARQTNTTLAGGDLAHSETIYCDVMVCGAVPKDSALRRAGAHPGDALYVSGTLGKPWERRIEPRLALGQSLRGRATSCMDLSDGLSLDLHRLCLASGVAAELDRVPIARGSTLKRALHGGEDYELLFTLPAKMKVPTRVTTDVTRIGTIVAVKAGVAGRAGAVTWKGEPLAAQGYDHFGIAEI